ncbi:MAG: hypothetical protein ACHQ4H_02195 [Ktedonobacterales bacterium]
MGGKVKMRCARCGKPFKSSGAKQTLCDECELKERRARSASKSAQATSTATAPVMAPKPKIVGPGANILVPGMVSPPFPALDPSAKHETQAGHHEPHAGPRPAHPDHEHTATHDGQRQAPRHPAASKAPALRPAATLRPKKEAPPAIMLTPELKERIEARYLELAQPVEFDGIRTKIAAELEVPKALVKKVVLDLRKNTQLPSWWELQSYHGTDADLERIRQAYLPHLPVPDVGIHKQLAETLALEPSVVYQGIRHIRAEMRLPQYNPPDAHAEGGASDARASAPASVSAGSNAGGGTSEPENAG